MSFKGYDTLVDSIELNYDVRAIESAEKGLFYLQDDSQKLIGIMTCKNGKRSIAILNKRQAYGLLNEFKDICDMVFERRII